MRETPPGVENQRKSREFGEAAWSAGANEENFGVGLDALSSAAYGPEAALTLLLPLGTAGLAYVAPLSGLIIAGFYLLGD